MHMHRGTTGTRVLTQNVPFRAKVLRVLTELNTIEIIHIVCAHITTRNFHLSLHRAVP